MLYLPVEMGECGLEIGISLPTGQFGSLLLRAHLECCCVTVVPFSPLPLGSTRFFVLDVL